MTTAAQRPGRIRALLAPFDHTAQEATMTDRHRIAWQSARQRAAVLSAELTRRAPLLGEYAEENTKLHQWHDEDRTALTEMRATIQRLRAELETARKVEASDTERLTHLEGENARLRSELTDVERRFLTFGPELTADDEAALERARRMADETQQAERVKHSGPEAEFCVLCLSGEHERVADEAQQAGEAGRG